MSDTTFSQAEIEKAITQYLKRRQYNEAWRAKNLDKVKGMRKSYNARKYAKEKLILAAAREMGLL